MRQVRSSKSRDRLALVLRDAGELVTVTEAASSLDLDSRAAAHQLARWASQGWLKRVQRGVYSPIPLDARTAERTLEDPWLLVPRFFAPGYIGGWTAAEHWGFTEQIFRDICVFTARRFRAKQRTIAGVGFALQRTQESAIFGTSTVWRGRTRVQVSDPHRTLVDLLARPASGGGIRHVAACLKQYVALQGADLARVIAYAEQLEVGAVFKRLGFLLERTGGDFAPILEQCRAGLTEGLAKLDPALASPRIVTRWRLRVPASWLKRSRDD
jgi:predicted transcriptional regulator of viral defense system